MAWRTRPTYREVDCREARFEGCDEFDGYCEVLPPPGVLTEASFEQLLSGNVGQPIMAYSNPVIGLFVRDMGLLPGIVGARDNPGYIPAWSSDGAIGRLAIGRSAIAYLHPYHEWLVRTPASGGIGDFRIALDGIGAGGPGVLREVPLLAMPVVDLATVAGFAMLRPYHALLDLIPGGGGIGAFRIALDGIGAGTPVSLKEIPWPAI